MEGRVRIHDVGYFTDRYVGTIASVAFLLVSFVLVVFNPKFLWLEVLASKVSGIFAKESDRLEPAMASTGENWDTVTDGVKEVKAPEAVPNTVSEQDLSIEEEILNSILNDDEEFESVGKIESTAAADNAHELEIEEAKSNTQSDIANGDEFSRLR